MLEFFVGFLLGAESARESRPLTWRSVSTFLVFLVAFSSGSWFVWKVLSGGSQPDACDDQIPLAQAWCEAASGLGSVLFVIVLIAAAIVLFGYVVRELKKG